MSGQATDAAPTAPTAAVVMKRKSRRLGFSMTALDKCTPRSLRRRSGAPALGPRFASPSSDGGVDEIRLGNQALRNTARPPLWGYLASFAEVVHRRASPGARAPAKAAKPLEKSPVRASAHDKTGGFA